MRKKDESAKTRKASPFVFMLHCMIGILICLTFSFIFSFLISGEKIPPTSIGAISCLSASFGACVASVLSAKKFGRIIITALIQGIVYFIVLYLLGAVLFSRMAPDKISPMIPLSCFAGALSGAIFAALFKRRRH